MTKNEAGGLSLSEFVSAKTTVMDESIDLAIRMCRLQEQSLQLIFDDPDLRKIYSQEKIIELNFLRRKLTKTIPEFEALGLRVKKADPDLMVSTELQDAFMELYSECMKIEEAIKAGEDWIIERRIPWWTYLAMPFTSIRCIISKIRRSRR